MIQIAQVDKKYLELLSKQFKNVDEVTEEIINLQAILNLPKGTEVFLSDIHGEYEPFVHILNNGAGIIRKRIETLFTNTITEAERSILATLIYYPEEKIKLLKKDGINTDDWYNITIYRLIEVAREITSKYTRSKVRKALKEEFKYIIDELLHIQGDIKNKESYHRQIIKTIVELQRADAFIVAISNLIKRMTIDHLHVIGDIYDRGLNAVAVMDALQKFHSLDIQWGNHDILWMGAACGNGACIANVVRMCSRYDNLDTLEEGYGINIRPLSTYAINTYKSDDCKKFIPKLYEYNKYSDSDKNIVAKIHKAITIIQFKLEGQLIKKHPEYEMQDRLFLDRIDYEKGIVTIGGIEYKLNDNNFPTIDKNDPYKLTDEELKIVERLQEAFLNSEKLQKHITFLYSKGSVYKIFNSNLLFHGCILMHQNGEFKTININGKMLKGKEYLDYIEKLTHKAYFQKEDSENNQDYKDYMWTLWCGKNSPFFGKEKMSTFEQYFLDNEDIKKEQKNAYFELSQKEEICNKVFEEFGLDKEKSHILNGHMPVKAKKGETPLRANGKLLVIDGGFAKSYREQTGEAGYTLVYNSYGLVLSANKPFCSKQEAIENEYDLKSEIIVNDRQLERTIVADTDIGKKLKSEVESLRMLLQAYQEGVIKEKR